MSDQIIDDKELDRRYAIGESIYRAGIVNMVFFAAIAATKGDTLETVFVWVFYVIACVGGIAANSTIPKAVVR